MKKQVTTQAKKVTGSEVSTFKRVHIYFEYNEEIFCFNERGSCQLLYKLINCYHFQSILKIVAVAWNSPVNVPEEIVMIIKEGKYLVYYCHKETLPRVIEDELDECYVSYKGELYTLNGIRRNNIDIDHRWIHLMENTIGCDYTVSPNTLSVEKLTQAIRKGLEAQSMRLNTATVTCFAPVEKTGVNSLGH